MKPKSAILTGAALIALAVVYVALVTEPGGGPRSAPERTMEPDRARPERSDSGPTTPIPAEVPPDSAPRAAIEAPAQTDGEAADLPAATGPGELRLSVLDAETLHHLDRLSVRGISEERFIDVDASSPISLPLSPGEYELLLLRARYDSVQLAPFSIVPDQTVDLGRALMHRGSGVVEGAVHVPPAGVESRLSVELHGAGRNPCNACAGIADPSEPCGGCGFSATKSVLAVEAGGSFAFAALAAGDYYLVVYDGPTVLLTRKLALASGERRWLDLELSFIDLDLRLTGPDGLPFTGHWYEEGELFTGPIRFFMLNDGTCCGASQWIPSPAGQTSEVLYEGPQTARPTGRAQRKWEPTRAEPTRPEPPPQVDVAKHPGQQLWPQLLTPPPAVRTRPLQTTFRAPDLFRVERVPLSSSAVLVACGPYFTNTRLSLPDWDGRPIEVRLSSRCPVPSKGLQGMAACTSCHALPAGVFQ